MKISEKDRYILSESNCKICGECNTIFTVGDRFRTIEQESIDCPFCNVYMMWII